MKIITSYCLQFTPGQQIQREFETEKESLRASVTLRQNSQSMTVGDLRNWIKLNETALNEK